MESKIGIIKTQISEFTIRDNEIARIIKDALKQQGFDLEVKPIIDVSTQFFTGEEFKVFRTE
jgi:hypothetical protein